MSFVFDTRATGTRAGSTGRKSLPSVRAYPSLPAGLSLPDDLYLDLEWSIARNLQASGQATALDPQSSSELRPHGAKVIPLRYAILGFFEYRMQSCPHESSAF